MGAYAATRDQPRSCTSVVTAATTAASRSALTLGDNAVRAARTRARTRAFACAIAASAAACDPSETGSRGEQAGAWGTSFDASRCPFAGVCWEKPETGGVSMLIILEKILISNLKKSTLNCMTSAKTHASLSVKTVIVPAAGMGTRFLPATKTIPKELLPVVDTPGIELIAQEAAQLGADKLAIITAPKKREVLAYFDRYPALETMLEARGKTHQLEKVRNTNNLPTPIAVEQTEPLGLGHAVGLAEQVLDDDENVVAVMLPDDLVLPMGVVVKMMEVRAQLGGSVLCAFEVPHEEVYNYGVFDIEDAPDYHGDYVVKKVRGMVEKPAVDDAPSNFVATGRYLLDRAIFDALQRITPGAGGELQLTDAIALLIDEGHPVHILVHDGKRHDLGNPGGYIPAVVDFGLADPVYGPHLKKVLREILDEHGA